MRLTRTQAIRCTASVFIFATASAFAQSPQSAQTAIEFERNFQHDAAILYREKDSRTPGMRKMDQNLIFIARFAKGENPWKELRKLEIHTTVRNDGTVDVRFAAPVTASLIAQIRALGGDVTGALPRYRVLGARMPARSLEAAAMLPGVTSLNTPYEPVADVGNKQNEGDVSMRTNELRSVYGLSGQGVKLGIMSDSNDYMEASQATGDLPPNIQVLTGKSGRTATGEGTAMMELAYDVAPSASLAFCTAFDFTLGQYGFAQNYRDLFAAGCNVISDDVFYYDEPAFQDGPVAQAVNDIFTNGGICFSSAGNAGSLRSGTSGVWEGDFADSGLILTYPNATVGKIHRWTASAANWRNQIPYIGTSRLTLQWNDPWENATSDYDLFIADSTGVIVTASMGSNVGGHPFEMVTNSQTNRYGVVVKHSGNDRVIRLNQVRGTLQYANGGQTWGHNSAANGIGVAAINAIRPTPRPFNAGDVTTYYSSDGLRRIYFDASGALIAPGYTAANAIVRNKPTLAAPDGVSTTVPNFGTFYGTSAASPNAAALTVLLRQFAPDATPTDLLNALTTGAVDILTPGYDKNSGAGAVSGQGAIKVLIEAKTLGVLPFNASVTDNDPATFTVDLGRNAPPAGLTLNLSATGDTGQFGFPATVSVPAGARTASFTVNAGAAGTGSALVTLREAYSGALVGTATVLRQPASPTVTSVAISKSVLTGGVGYVTVTVNLAAKATAPYTAEISTDAPSIVSPPTAITIAKGSSSAKFTLTALPIAVDTSVKIRARRYGSTVAWTEGTLTVKAPVPSLVQLNSTSGYAGSVVTTAVQLSGPAPSGGYSVDLSSGDMNLISVPATLNFAAGATSASFNFTVGAASEEKAVAVRATKGATAVKAVYKVLVPEVSVLTVNPTSVKGGTSVTGAVGLTTQARAGGVVVRISRTSGTGVTVPVTVTVPEGSRMVTFTIATTAVTSQKVATIYASTSSVKKTATLTVNP